MSFRRRAPHLVLTVFLLGVLAPLGRAEEPELVRFGFEPEDGLVLIKTMDTYTKQDFKGRGPVRENTIHSKVRMELDRGEHGSWSILIDPLEATTEVNGAPAENPAQKVWVTQPRRIHLDESGRAVAGDGFEELMRKFERELPPPTYARVRQSVSAESMRNVELALWNRPFEGLRGEEVQVGDVWLVLSETTMQGDFIPLSGTLTFEGWTELDGVRALRIVHRFDAAGETYAAAEDSASRSLNLRPEDRRDYTRHNLMIEGSTTWLLAPERGIPLYETHEEVMRVPLSPEPGAERGEIIQNYTYRYQLQSALEEGS